MSTNSYWDITNSNIYIYQIKVNNFTSYTLNTIALQSSQLVIPITFDSYKDSGTVSNFIISKDESKNILKIVVHLTLGYPSPLESELRVLSLNL